MLFIDVETSSPDPEKPDLSLDTRRNVIDLIGIMAESGEIFIKDNSQVPPNAFAIDKLAGHGFKFDFKTLHYKGYLLNVANYIHDTLIMATALVTKVPDSYLEQYEVKRRQLNKDLSSGQSYRQAKKHSLKVLAPYFLGVSPFWENPETYNDPEYLKKDVLYTKGLYDHFVPMMKNEGVWEFYNDRLMPWQRMTLEAELDGININLTTLMELKAQAEAGVLSSLSRLRLAWSKVEEEYYYKQQKEVMERYVTMAQTAKAKIKPEDKKADEKRTKISQRYLELQNKALTKVEPFNYASPSQLLWAFKDVLHYPTINMEGDETTGASVLEVLAAQGKEDIKALLEYKENYKLAHAYYPSYLEMQVDGKIHCSFNINAARTGRTSSSNPNLQQVPPVIKKIFVPAEGNSLVSQDLSAIEPVLIAYYTEDENLCRILINNEDFHGVAAVQFELVDCLAHEVKEKAKDARYAAKQGDLSIFYGSGKKRLFITLTLNGIKQVKGQLLSEQITAKMVKNFRAYFKESWEFKEMLDAELLSGNYVENLFGRRFKIDNPEEVYMKGFNNLIQGSASDLLLQGTHDCLQELKREGIWTRLRLLVHDNTVLECKDEDAEYVNSRLCYHLTKFKLNTKHGLIPLKVEGNYGKTWKS